MKTFKQFLADKSISDEDWKAKTAEEMAALHKEYNEAVQKSIADAIKNKTDEKAVKSLIDNAIKGIEGFATSEQMKSLEDILKKQGEALANLKSEGNSENQKDFSTLLAKQLLENKEELKAMMTKKGEGLRITVKEVGNMTFGSNVTGQIPQADRESGITSLPRRNPFLLDLIPTSSIDSNLWEWVEMKNPEGEAAMTAEGEKKAQIDFDLVLADAKVKKVTAFIKVSKEMLDDIDDLRNEIDRELMRAIYLKVDEQLMNGDGTGENLTGVTANATPFAAGTFAGTVNAPNNADVLRIAVNQVTINHFDATHIVLHPSAMTALEVQKASNGHYILPPFASVDGRIISGIRVIENTGVGVNEFIVADLSRYAARIKEGLTIDVGYENDDFTKNFVTILGEMRIAARIKSNHYGAVVVGDFEAAKGLLETTETVE